MNKTFFSSLDELKEGFDCNMEYDIKLVGCEYYIVFFWRGTCHFRTIRSQCYYC